MTSSPPLYGDLQCQASALAVALGYRDQLTQLHCERVAGMAGQLGRHIGLDSAQLTRLAIAGAMHDIGKIGIPDHILLKKGKLDEIEWQIMQQHSEAGENIITAVAAEGAKETATIIRHHHEHFDGLGYPDGIAGESIPVCARIIGIADSYDAMCSPRPYHLTRSHDDVMAILEQERGSKHDPWLLDRFDEVIGSSEYRVRSA